MHLNEYEKKQCIRFVEWLRERVAVAWQNRRL